LETRTLPKNTLKRGMVLAEDIHSGGKIICDRETVLTLFSIRDIERAEDIENVNVLIKESVSAPWEDPGKKAENFKIDPTDELIEKLYLTDFDLDKEIEVLKDVKNITRHYNERVIEGFDFVLRYFANNTARKIIAEGIVNLGNREFYRLATIALLDEEKEVRQNINRYFLKYKEDLEIAEHIIRSYPYVTDECMEEYLNIWKKIFPETMLQKVQKKGRDEGSDFLIRTTTAVLEMTGE